MDCKMEPKTSYSSALNKQILNNFIVKTRSSVRRGKVHVINRIIRRARQLRQQKTGNEKEKEKLYRKADKLLEELVILRKFHEDDLTKFALMNKKSLIEATNDINSSTEERALCRLANWKTVTPEINKFREEYPDWEDKVPQLLKSIGLQYRHKRLKRLEKKGRKELFLEKEHHNINILQKLTHIDVDPRLLAKAQDLINTSKKDDDIGKGKFDRKYQDSYEHQEMEDQGQDAERDISERDRDVVPLKVQKKTGKKLSKKKRVIENQDKDSIEEHNDGKVASVLQKSYCKGVSKKEYKKEEQEEVSEECASGDESLADKSSSKMRENLVKRVSGNQQELEDQDGDSGDEGISDDKSDEDEASSGAWESGRNGILHEQRREELDDDSEGENMSNVESNGAEASLDMQEKHGKYTLKEQQKMEEQHEETSEEDSEEDEDSEEGLLSDSESDIDEGFLEKAKEGLENIYENQGKSNKVVLQKKKEKLKKNKVLKDHQNDLEKKKQKLKEDVTSDSEEDVMSDSEGDVMSDSEGSVMSDSEGSVMFDSEGSISDENGGETEITSIWEHWKEDSDTKDKKVSQPGAVNRFSQGNKLIRSKGTVEIMQLDLTDQSCGNVLFKGNDEVASDSEEEDFFVKEPKIKKRKRPKENTSDQDRAVSDSDGSCEAGDDVDHSDNEITSRGRYLDKNFKRIWGRGVDEQFLVTHGRRGTSLQRGGGRGRAFDGGRGRAFDGGRGRGYRSQPIGNRNLISIGTDSSNLSPGKGYGNPNMIPVSSDWRSKLSTDQSKYSNPNMTSVTSDWKSKATSAAEGGEQPDDKWRRGSFNKQYETNTDMDPGRSNWNNRFSSGRRDQGEHLKPSWKRGRFEKRDPDNPNLAPVSGHWTNNAAPSANNSTQNSLLHPSWLAKQKERKMASSINHFQGKVKKFDLDD